MICNDIKELFEQSFGIIGRCNLFSQYLFNK